MGSRRQGEKAGAATEGSGKPRLGSEAAQDRFPARYVRRAAARHQFGALADRYADFMLVGDPLADALAATLDGDPDARARFDRALRVGADSSDPDALRAFFAHAERRPSWLDDEQLELGARTYRRLGKATMWILSSWSLMNGYHSGAAVKPLVFTGHLRDRAPRRLAETGRFVVATMEPGSLGRYGRGFELTLRVRLMHAMVRRRIERSGRWDAARWGAPINQADMVGTVIEFSLLVLAGARALGYRFEPSESEALLHLWRYSGYLSGVDEELLAELASEARGVRFAELVALVQPGPDEDSRALAAALRQVPAQVARGSLERRLAPLLIKLHDGFTHAFNGRAMADALGIPNAPYRHALPPLRAVVGGLERVRRLLPDGDERFARWGHRAVRDHIDGLLGGIEPTFDTSGG